MDTLVRRLLLEQAASQWTTPGARWHPRVCSPRFCGRGFAHAALEV